ncbi:MAG: hypothetical protein MZV70_46115 [Desulfobacterales bacterium]|nr:hypothetical protein [Desulfobacterales bacterium]
MPTPVSPQTTVFSPVSRHPVDELPDAADVLADADQLVFHEDLSISLADLDER